MELVEKKIPENLVYRKLQQHLDKFPIGFPPTDSGVELRILRYLFTEAEANLALCLGLKPTSLDIIRKRMAKRGIPTVTLSDLEATLDRLYTTGRISRVVNKGRKKYSNTWLAIGMFENQVNNLDPEFYTDFDTYLHGAFGDECAKSKIPQLRTVPISRSIVPEHRIAPYDDMVRKVQKMEGAIAVQNCICKQGKDLKGEPCRQTKKRETCILFGRMATEAIDLGRARMISKKDTLQLLALAEKDGLVLQPNNSLEEFCICCCCGDCCAVLNPLNAFPNPSEYVASNYYSTIDPEKCTGCGVCLTRCQMQAIQKDNGKCHVNTDRCIGCGLCVPYCKPKAACLIKKSKVYVPPRNAVLLYLKIMEQRLGRGAQLTFMLKWLLGMNT